MAQSLIEGVTNYWCRTIGIHNNDLDTHPQMDDVILLIKFIREFSQQFNNDDRIATYVIWDWCYNKRLPIRRKQFKRLLNIGQRIRRKNFFKQAELNKARQKIRTLTSAKY
jgi:hypothetical protein